MQVYIYSVDKIEYNFISGKTKCLSADVITTTYLIQDFHRCFNEYNEFSTVEALYLSVSWEWRGIGLFE